MLWWEWGNKSKGNLFLLVQAYEKEEKKLHKVTFVFLKVPVTDRSLPYTQGVIYIWGMFQTALLWKLYQLIYFDFTFQLYCFLKNLEFPLYISSGSDWPKMPKLWWSIRFKCLKPYWDRPYETQSGVYLGEVSLSSNVLIFKSLPKELWGDADSHLKIRERKKGKVRERQTDKRDRKQKKRKVAKALSFISSCDS